MMDLKPSAYFTVSCLFIFILLPMKVVADETTGNSQNVCVAEQDSPSCLTADKQNVQKECTPPCSKETVENGDSPETDSLFHRSMQELEVILDKMATSKDQMMNDLIDKMSESRKKMMEALDSMMDKMSESRTTVMEGMDSMLQKMMKSKENMVEGLDNVLDQVSHSRMMEEIDQIIEIVSHSKVIQELRALPQEIRQSFILSARNRSYIAGGVMVAIAATILFCGAIYYAWCHHDAWSYYIGTIEEAKALLRQAKESSFIRRSRSSSEDLSSNESETSSEVLANQGKSPEGREEVSSLASPDGSSLHKRHNEFDANGAFCHEQSKVIKSKEEDCNGRGPSLENRAIVSSEDGDDDVFLESKKYQ